MRATYISCIGTHAHGRQVTPLLCLSDFSMNNCILAYTGTLKNKNSSEQEKYFFIRVRVQAS